MTPIKTVATLPAWKGNGELKVRTIRNESREFFVEIGIWFGEKPSQDRITLPLSLVSHVQRAIKEAKDIAWSELKKAGK